MPEHREIDVPIDGQIRGARVVASLAARQHGVVSRGQLLDAGVTATMIDKRVRRGHLVPLHRGVYAVGHAHLRREGHWLAAVLAVGPHAALSHRDAAALHELRPSNGTRIDVTTSAERKSTAKVRVHGRRALGAQDVTTIAGIRTTTVARTLVDLAEAVPQQALAKALSEAERQGKLDVRALDQALGRTRGRHGPGPAKIRQTLAEHAALGARLTKSTLEDRFVTLLDAHSLPHPRLNAWIGDREGDAVWAAERLVVELDGWDSHKTRRAFQRDREKGNALLAAGWTLLRFTYRDVVDRPAHVATTIAEQLSRAGGSARPPRPAGRPA